MSEQNYTNRQLLKVMLEVAKRVRTLNPIEENYFRTIDNLSDNRKKEIIRFMENKKWIKSHSHFFNQPQNGSNTSTIIFPMLSSEGEGLSEKGEDKLKDIIHLLEESKKAERNKKIIPIAKWIGGIITGLIVAFIVYKLGWNK